MAIALPASDANNLNNLPATETESDDGSVDEMTESLRSFENFFMRKLEISDGKIVNVGEDENGENCDKQLIAVEEAKSSSLQPQFGYFLPLPIELLRKRVKR